jgi:hypothetical protein
MENNFGNEPLIFSTLKIKNWRFISKARDNVKLLNYGTWTLWINIAQICLLSQKFDFCKFWMLEECLNDFFLEKQDLIFEYTH